MSSGEELPRSKSTPVQTTANRPKLALANEEPNAATNPQAVDPQLTKAAEKIPTFIIWSVFNLVFVPFGILCCFFSYKVSQFKIQNRLELARKWSKRTFVLNLMTALLMIGIIITIVMLNYDALQRNAVQANQTRTTGAYIPWQPGR